MSGQNTQIHYFRKKTATYGERFTCRITSWDRHHSEVYVAKLDNSIIERTSCG